MQIYNLALTAGEIYAIDAAGSAGTCTPVVPGCVPPPTNLVLWLPFDETNGSLSANLASPANYGVQINRPTPLLGLYVANSLLFDGSNYVVVPNYPALEIGTGDLTVDAWVYDMGGNGQSNAVILDKRATNNDAGYSLWLGSQAGLTFNMSGQLFTELHPIPAFQWHFVAVSVTQSNLTPQGFFYVDGVLSGTFGPSAASMSNTNPLWIAASAPNPFFGVGQPWLGALDEVEVFNRALSTNELYGIYSAGMAGKCKPCCYLEGLTIAKVSGAQVEVVWGGCGTLEGSTNVLGPGVGIPAAASPYIIPATGLEMFYRLECP